MAAVVGTAGCGGEAAMLPPPPRRRRLLGKQPRPPDAEKEPLRTLVISLDRRQDRWASVCRRLTPVSAQGLLLVERWSATDGAVAGMVPESDVLRTWTTDRNAKYDGRQGYRPGVKLCLTDGERGCALSHVRAWREVLASPTGCPVLVLEDDAVPLAGFEARLGPAVADAAAAGADVLYLGYIKGAKWRRKIKPGLREAEYLWTTVAYVLWPRGARRLLDRLPVDCPVDNFMAWQAASRRIKALAVEPEMVEQEAEWDVGSDVPHSDDVVLES